MSITVDTTMEIGWFNTIPTTTKLWKPFRRRAL